MDNFWFTISDLTLIFQYRSTPPSSFQGITAFIHISGKINPEQLLAQSKKGKPTMIFFNVREKFCDSEKQLAKITSKYASLLLNGNIQVQNYPVSNVLIAWVTVHELKFN